MHYFSELYRVKFLHVGSGKVLDWTNKEEKVILQLTTEKNIDSFKV